MEIPAAPCLALVAWGPSCPASSTGGFFVSWQSWFSKCPSEGCGRDTRRESRCPGIRFLRQGLKGGRGSHQCCSEPSEDGQGSQCSAGCWVLPGELLSRPCHPLWDPRSSSWALGPLSPPRTGLGCGGTAQNPPGSTCLLRHNRPRRAAFLPRPPRADASLSCQGLLTHGGSCDSPFLL